MAVENIIPIDGEHDIVVARQSARSLAKELGFGAVDQSRIATAVSELARNVVRYAIGGRGTVKIRAVDGSHGTGVEIVVSDDGPGIMNVELAMSDGYTSSRGMGLGLPGTRRLMDDMRLDSEPGKGTTVTIRKWRR